MKAREWGRRMPWDVVIVLGALVALGLLGIGRAEELTGSGGRFVRRQIVWAVIALGGMFLVTLPNYRVLCRYSYALLGLAVALLGAVFLFPPINGAHRWMRFAGLSLQPSELAKVALVMALARYLMYRDSQRRLRGMLLPLAMTLVPMALVLREPDLGTALVFAPVLLVMLWAAGARTGDLAKIVAMGLVAAPLLWMEMSREQRSRITALFEQAAPGERPDDDGYHLFQAKQMLALGARWGSALAGETVDDPGAYRLPEAHTDFIYCVLGERFGWLGTGGVLLLYALLTWRGLRLAESTREPFGRLVAVGLVALVGVQVLINTAMTVGLAPITGLSLPLVSYGGSGLVAHCLGLGLLLNIGMRPGFEVTNEPFRFGDGPA